MPAATPTPVVEAATAVAPSAAVYYASKSLTGMRCITNTDNRPQRGCGAIRPSGRVLLLCSWKTDKRPRVTRERETRWFGWFMGLFPPFMDYGTWLAPQGPTGCAPSALLLDNIAYYGVGNYLCASHRHHTRPSCKTPCGHNQGRRQQHYNPPIMDSTQSPHMALGRT